MAQRDLHVSHLVHDARLRETTLARPYIIRYRVDPDRVVILRVRHGARRLTRPGTLYVGVTSNIARRVWEHRSSAIGGFVRDYGVRRLVFVELHESMADAILREKRLKKWRRAWKPELIERLNPQGRDLYDEPA